MSEPIFRVQVLRANRMHEIGTRRLVTADAALADFHAHAAVFESGADMLRALDVVLTRTDHRARGLRP